MEAAVGGGEVDGGTDGGGALDGGAADGTVVATGAAVVGASALLGPAPAELQADKAAATSTITIAALPRIAQASPASNSRTRDVKRCGSTRCG